MNTLQKDRERAKLSQRGLGRQAGTTGQTIGRIEKGQFDPEPLLAIRIAAVLKRRPDDVFPDLAPLFEAVRNSDTGADQPIVSNQSA